MTSSQVEQPPPQTTGVMATGVRVMPWVIEFTTTETVSVSTVPSVAVPVTVASLPAPVVPPPVVVKAIILIDPTGIDGASVESFKKTVQLAAIEPVNETSLFVMVRPELGVTVMSKASIPVTLSTLSSIFILLWDSQGVMPVGVRVAALAIPAISKILNRMMGISDFILLIPNLLFPVPDSILSLISLI
jgi:hypothetical protein